MKSDDWYLTIDTGLIAIEMVVVVDEMLPDPGALWIGEDRRCVGQCFATDRYGNLTVRLYVIEPACVCAAPAAGADDVVGGSIFAGQIQQWCGPLLATIPTCCRQEEGRDCDARNTVPAFTSLQQEAVDRRLYGSEKPSPQTRAGNKESTAQEELYEALQHGCQELTSASR